MPGAPGGGLPPAAFCGLPSPGSLRFQPGPRLLLAHQVLGSHLQQETEGLGRAPREGTGCLQPGLGVVMGLGDCAPFGHWGLTSSSLQGPDFRERGWA